MPYVRERWCDGERLPRPGRLTPLGARRYDEVAGARVHGTTRAVPREVFAAEEKVHLSPQARFDFPAWSQAKVHPDQHVQVARALYSVPTAYIGRQLDVRLDSKTVRLYSGAEIVKVHGRVAPGKRSTDPNEYPRTKTPTRCAAFTPSCTPPQGRASTSAPSRRSCSRCRSRRRRCGRRRRSCAHAAL